MAEAAYFGTRYGHPGHFWFGVEGRPVAPVGSLDPIGPWGEVDGRLVPASTTRQGAAILHHFDGWTALALHDYTGDTRPGSNSVFVFHEDLTFADAVSRANDLFPDVARRIGQIVQEEA